MDSIFLTPETTFDVSIRVDKESKSIKIEDGGPYRLRTATGREFARLQRAIHDSDSDAAFNLFRIFVVSGIPEDKIEQLHPDVVWFVLVEVLKRSRVSEEQQGK